MKKIHITESQLNYLKSKINETTSDEITIDAQPEPNGSVTTQGLKTQYNDAKTKVGSGTNVKISVDGADLKEGVDETRMFTKKQIQEARIANLRKNCTVYKKKNLK